MVSLNGMGTSQAVLAELYFVSLLLGCAFGLIYDLLRITRIFFGVHYSMKLQPLCERLPLPKKHEKKKRIEKKHRKISAAQPIIFLQDFWFCILFAVSMAIVFYEINSGGVRLPAFFFAGVGFVLYRFTIGKPVLLFSETIAFFVKFCIRWCVFGVTYPFWIVWRFLCRRVQNFAKKYVTYREKAARKRYTETEGRKIGVLPVKKSAGQKRRERWKSRRKNNSASVFW